MNSGVPYYNFQVNEPNLSYHQQPNAEVTYTIDKNESKPNNERPILLFESAEELALTGKVSRSLIRASNKVYEVFYRISYLFMIVIGFSVIPFTGRFTKFSTFLLTFTSLYCGYSRCISCFVCKTICKAIWTSCGWITWSWSLQKRRKTDCLRRINTCHNKFFFNVNNHLWN